MMPEPRSMNVAIFFDDANQSNVPLMIIKGNHKRGVPKIGHDLAARSYPFWDIGNKQIRQLLERPGQREGGIVSPQGPVGSMILFHGCLVHSSTSTLSP